MTSTSPPQKQKTVIENERPNIGNPPAPGQTSQKVPEFQAINIEIKETPAPVVQRQRGASDKSVRVSEIKNKKVTLEPLYTFIEEIKKPDRSPEVVSIEYLKIYKDDPKFLIDNKELQKFLPNINIKQEYRLMKLFGVESLALTHPREADKQLFSLSSKQYIVATMLNSPSYNNIDQKIQFAFQMYDRDEDGKICLQDLKDLFSFYGKESQFGLTEGVIEEAAKVIAEEIGIDTDGKISFMNFKRFFEKSEGKKVKVNVFEKGKAQRPKRKPSSYASEARMIVNTEDRSSINSSNIISRRALQNINPSRMYSEPIMQVETSFAGKQTEQSRIETPNKIDIISQARTEILGETPAEVLSPLPQNLTKFQRFKGRLEVEKAKWIWLFIWLAGAIALWVTNFIKYYNQTNTFPVGFSKGCAAVIYYNMGIMFLLITKSVTTILRALHLSHLLPLNFNVFFHKVLGISTLVLGFAHGISHITGSYRALSSFDNLDDLNSILYTPMDELHSYTWWLFASLPSITGFIIIIMMTILVIFALKKNRRKNYERFWYSHMLWLPLVVLLAIHGSKKYIAQYYFIYVVGFPSLLLVIEKLITIRALVSDRFKLLDMSFVHSDLIELKVSKPKGYTYRPGQYALIHMRALSLFQWHPFSFSSGPSDEIITFHISPVGDWTRRLKRMAVDYKNGKIELPKISLMGPYGAPSQHYNDYRHLMIFCTGVGATPFASILREFVHKALQDKNLNYSVEFYWMCRNPANHQWMSKLFADLQAHQRANEIVNIHMFFTGPHEKYDLRMFLLWIGLHKLYERGKVIEGMEHFNIMNWGRPDWEEIFIEKKKEVKRGNVGVFFCGNEILAKEIRQKCYRHSRNVNFKFAKEIF